MVASQRMKVANEKASKYVTMRGNVPKSSVSQFYFVFLCFIVYTSHLIVIAFQIEMH